MYIDHEIGPLNAHPDKVVCKGIILPEDGECLSPEEATIYNCEPATHSLIREGTKIIYPQNSGLDSIDGDDLPTAS